MDKLRIVKCERCGHMWATKINPKVCAKCHNVYWNIPRNK